MPLLLLFGQPLTGKSALAARIREAAKADCRDVVVVDLALMGCTNRSLTENIGTVRTRLRQLVSQYLSKERLVIVDHTNHTKSFRYELFGIARARQTTNCIVSTYTDRTFSEQELVLCEANVAATGTKEPLWSYSCYTDMCSRFEGLLVGAKADEPVFDTSTDPKIILDYLYNTGKTPKRNKSKAPVSGTPTTLAPSSTKALTNAAVARITKDIIVIVFNAQAASGLIDATLSVHKSMASVAIPHRIIPPDELHALRRSYLQSNTQDLNTLTEDLLVTSFAKYLSAELLREQQKSSVYLPH